MKVPSEKIAAALNAMTTVRSMKAVADISGLAAGTIQHLAQDFPLWNWFRLQAEDGRKGANPGNILTWIRKPQDDD